MAEVDIEVKIASAKTIAEIERLKKELTSVYKATTLGTKENEAAAKALVQVKEQLAKSSEKVATANGKMMHSYFEAGEELRRFYREQRVGDRTMRETGNVAMLLSEQFGAKGLGKGLGVAFESFQSAEFAVNGLGIAAQDAGGKMAVFGQKIMSVAEQAVMPLAAVGVQIMAIKGAIEETTVAAEKYEAAAIKAGLLNPREVNVKKYKGAKRMAFGFDADLLTNLASGNPFLSGLLRGAGIMSQMATQMEARSELQPGQYLGDGISTVGTVLDEMTVTGSPQKKASNDPWDSYRTRQQIGALGYQGTSIAQWTPGKIKMGVDSLDTVQTKVEGINSNVIQIGDALATSLSQGFMRGFETGESVLKTFADSVLASIMGIAAQQTAIAGISGILSLIPGVGTFSSIAGAMGSLFFNTSPTAGVDVTSGKGGVVSELRSIRGAIQSQELRIDNMGLYMGAERGRVAFERS